MPDQHKIVSPWPGWSLDRLLGQGTYGRVYLFKREEYGNTYFTAIKHIAIPTDQNQKEGFFAEGLVTDAISLQAYCTQLLESFMGEINVNVELRGHTNFVSYDDHQIIPAKDGPGYDIYIKMEYLTNLRTFIPENQLTLGDVLRLGTDICTALSVLQKRNLIHRDIKPENIFINKNGDFKLGDFGIVRSLDEFVTRMTARGTLTFMAPELARHEKCDYRIDLYSLGLVLYRLLNGNRAPFLPPLPAKVTHYEYNIAQDLRMGGENLPPPAYADTELASIILKACAFKAEQRFKDAGQMKEKLLEYGNSLSPQAKQALILDLSAKNNVTVDIILPKSTQELSNSGLLIEVSSPLLLLWQNIRKHSQKTYDFCRVLIQYLQGGRKYWQRSSLIVAAFVVVLGMLVFLLLNTPKTATLQIETEMPPNSPSEAVVEPFDPAQPINSKSPAENTAKKDPAESIDSSELTQAVSFHDLIFGAAIAKQLHKEIGDIYPEDLLGISEIKIDNGQVQSLEDLAALPSLRSLDLANQQLPDPALLGQLKKLESLNLSGCHLSEASFIAELTALSSLNISNNQLTELGFVEYLTHLEFLDISDNAIADLAPLSALNEDVKLVALGTAVQEWGSVAHITDVEGREDSLQPQLDPQPQRDRDTQPQRDRDPQPQRDRDPQPQRDPQPKPDDSPPELDPPPSIQDPVIVKVTLNKSSLLLEIDESSKINASVSPGNIAGQALNWSSSNPAIATVDNSGNIKALSPGTAIITVTYAGEKATCRVSVN